MERKIHDEEISLKELISEVLTKWKVVAVCGAITLIIAIVYLFGFTQPVYETSISGALEITETNKNKYGVYSFPANNKADLINEISNDKVLQKTIDSLKWNITPAVLRDQVSVTFDKNTNKFTIVLRADSSEDVLALAAKMKDISINHVIFTYKEKMIKYFLNENAFKSIQYSEELRIEKMVLAGMKEELVNIPPTLILKRQIVNNSNLAIEIIEERGLDLSNLTDSTAIFEEVINPNYTKMESMIVETKNRIQSKEIGIDRNRVLNDELKTYLIENEKYRVDGDSSGMSDINFDAIIENIVIITNRNISTQVEIPLLRNLSFALLAGLLFGIMIVLFKYYWRSN